MDETPNLNLPYILPSQAQKHVTHNEAIRALDALVQLSVLDRDLATPPGSPTDGDRYIVAAGAGGGWTGHAGDVAAFQDGGWAFYQPGQGWLAWVADEATLVAWDGTDWNVAGPGSVNPVPLVGVNATADATNRLSVSSPATLFDHEGAGHQLKINKDGAGDDATILFQTGYSGRAEMGLAGDDDYHFKVSPDGSSWHDAMLIDRSSGAVRFPATDAVARKNLLINGDFQINQRGFAGGSLAAGDFGFDRWKADSGGADLSLSGLVLTLTSGAIVQPVEPSSFAMGSMASRDFAVSIENPSADLSVSLGSATATIVAGSGRRQAVLSTGSGDTGNLDFKIAKASGGSVTLGRIKLEPGAWATPWALRERSAELDLCYRYFWRSANSGYLAFLADTTTTGMGAFIQFPVEMRALPTCAFSNPHNASPTYSLLVGGSFRDGSTIAGALDRKGVNAYTTISSGTMTAGEGYLGQGVLSASAEL